MNLPSNSSIKKGVEKISAAFFSRERKEAMVFFFHNINSLIFVQHIDA